MSSILTLPWRRKSASKPSMNSSGPGSLPQEILEKILQLLRTEDISWKAGLVRVSQSWYSIAIPLLYEVVEPLSMRAMSRLNSTIRKHPALACHIRILAFPRLESETSTTISFDTERGCMRRWVPSMRRGDWLRTYRVQTPVTIYTHSRRKAFMDGKSIRLLLEWFIEVAVCCTRLHTLQLPTVDFKVPKNVLASILAPVKHLILVQLYVENYGTMRNDVLADAANVETLTISGAFSKRNRRNFMDAFIDSSFFPKLHTINAEHFISPELVMEVIRHHGTKLNNLTLWPKSTVRMPVPDSGFSDQSGSANIKRLTIISIYHEPFLDILSLRGLASLTFLEIHIFTLRYLPDILYRLSPTVEDLIVSNLAWPAGNPDLAYDELYSLRCDSGNIPQRYPALRSFSIFWRAKPPIGPRWSNVASDLRDIYNLAGIKFRMELVPNDEDLLLGTPIPARDRYRWTRR